MNKRYENRNYVHIKKIFYEDSEYLIEDKHCCEVIKQEFHKCKQIILFIPQNKVKYNKDEIDNWLMLLKKEKLKFDYKIDEKYHHIILNPLDYTHVNHMYLTMVLVRYLWFKENDCLIDKINDILKTGEFNFTQALSIAHCYDIIDRDTTFNICFQNTFPVLDDINFNEIYYYGSYLLNTHIYRQSFNCFFDELDSSRNLAIFNAQLAMYLISEKIKEGADYNTVWKLMHSFKRISFNYVEDIKKNILITLKLFNKNETITEVQSDDLEIGKKYLLLSNNSLQNKFYVTYKGLTYPHRTNLHYYKTFNNDEINTRGTNFKFYRIDEKENTTI